MEEEKRLFRSQIREGFTAHKALQKELNKEIHQKPKIRMVRPVEEPRPQFETEEDAVHRIFVEEVLRIKPSEEKTEEEKKTFRTQVWEGFNSHEKLQKDLNKEISEKVQIRMIRPSPNQEEEEEEYETAGDESEESKEELRRRAEEYLNLEEIVQNRLHARGIRDPDVVDEAIKREREIRKIQYELRVRDEEFKEGKKVFRTY